ncbi:MAG: glycine zipper family protein [Catenulispora sp.]|nr:glycine zipper family protein [Catenulispora sp.]
MSTGAGVASALVHTAYGVVLGALAGGLTGALVLGGIGLLLGILYGWAAASSGAYSGDARGIWLFVVDHTWSMPNTVAGGLFLAAQLVAGHSLDRVVSAGACRISVDRNFSPQYATTIGPVCAGANPGIQRHEDVHVFQARLLGPLYLPLVAGNYALFAVAPIWLIYHDHAAAPINRIGRYFEVGVYPHVWNEAIAYRIQGTPPR